MGPDEKMLRDIARAEPVERKAISSVLRLSVGGIDDILWTDDSQNPVERRKRDFRVVIGDLVIPFEVKADFKSEVSGNIALEYLCWPDWANDWMSSGLASTGSDVWVQMVPCHSNWKMYFAKVADLRKNLMKEIVPGCWRPNKVVEGVNYLRTTDNAVSQDKNATMNMLLQLQSHVMERDWWYDGDAMKDGAVDWRYFAAE